MWNFHYKNPYSPPGFEPETSGFVVWISDIPAGRHVQVSPSLWAQTFLVDYSQENGTQLTTADATGTNGLTSLPKPVGALDNIFLVTHPLIDQNCLASDRTPYNF
jgi:hypothetical protein